MAWRELRLLLLLSLLSLHLCELLGRHPGRKLDLLAGLGVPGRWWRLSNLNKF